MRKPPKDSRKKWDIAYMAHNGFIECVGVGHCYYVYRGTLTNLEYKFYKSAYSLDIFYIQPYAIDQKNGTQLNKHIEL